MLEVPSKYSSTFGEIEILDFLGKGKSGFSYLGKLDKKKIVLKIMHQEKISYYTFDANKVELEVNAYNTLSKITNKIPKLISFDADNNYLIKEFIDGESASSIIAKQTIEENHLIDLITLAVKFEEAELNLDYFPTNFVIKDSETFYIDYEVNPFNDEWSLRNWGLYYWLNSKGFAKFLETKDASFINQDVLKGIPHKKEFEEQVENIFKKYIEMK